MTRPREFRTETAPVEITRGPTVNHPGDPYRVYVPGLTAYFVDDVEVTEAEYRAARAVNSRGEIVDLDTPEARSIAKTFGVPDHLIGIPSPWWRRFWQRHTRQP